MKNSFNRLRYIDIAKGIAMICIILGHLNNSGINRVVFTFHVPIFFFITGYFISNKKTTFDFIKNKARTLLVPYFVTCAVIIVIGVIKGSAQGDDGILSRLIFATLYAAGDTYKEPFFIPGIGAIWFLWATFFGSIFLRISLNMNRIYRICFVIVLFIFGYFSREIFWFPLSIQAGSCATFFMYLGFLVKEAGKYLKNLSIEIKIISAIIASVVWLEFIIDFKSFWLVHCDIGRGAIDIIGCICASAIVILISVVIDKIGGVVASVISYFGKYSLFVLCIHIVELKFIPWKTIAEYFVQAGMPDVLQLPVIITGKLVLDLTLTYVLSKVSIAKKVFGIKS